MTKSAIIDIGSNTIRLVIYKYSSKDGVREISNIKTVARLRSYIRSSGEMSEEGIQLLENTLTSLKEILDEYEVEYVIAAATAAVRQASNRQEIVDRMKEKTGIKIDILTEEEEAYYGYLAVVHSIETPSAVTIDIGGGSTEITLYKDKQLVHTHSFPFGTVSLKQRFVQGDIITEDEKKELVSYVKKKFQSLPWIQNLKLPVIGIGGSARNIAQVHQQQIEYPISGVHHYEMSKNDLTALSNFLRALDFEQLKRLDGLSTDRADTIGPALEVFRTLVDVVDSKLFQVTSQGLREGVMIHKILENDPNAFDKFNIIEHSSRKLAHEYGRQNEEINYLRRLTEQIYKECCQLGLFEYSERNLQLICKASQLFDIGSYIEMSSSSQHTFYLIANQSINGLPHLERVKLALLASFRNKDYFRRFSEPFDTWFSVDELRELKDLGAMLKFIYALNISKRLIVSSVQLIKIDDIVHLNIRTTANATAEKYQTSRQKKHLERAIRHEVQLNFIEEG